MFGDDWEKGTMLERGTMEYLVYIENVLHENEEAYNQSVLHSKTVEMEQKLWQLSLSPLPASHAIHGQAGAGQAGVAQNGADAQQQWELLGVSMLADRLSKLCPEFYWDLPKTYEKITFRELMRGCINVLAFLCSSNIDVDGYLSHLGFLMDKASMAEVYTMESLSPE